MDVIKIVEETMGQNSYLVVEGESAILIDAGVYVNKVEENLKLFSPKPRLEAILLTHAHFDHIRQLDNIISKYKCPAYIYKAGKQMLYDENKNVSYLDVPFKIKSKKDVKTFLDGDTLKFGDIEIRCFNTPGHSIDSSCFVINDSMFVGDNVFKVEVGRTDLYSGDENMQRISLERIRDVLSQDVDIFYAGHGPNFDRDDLKYNINRILGE